MIASARDRFQKNKDNAQAWANVTATELFIEATQVALLHMHSRMPTPKTMADAAANEMEMRGARVFLDHLTNLAIPEQPKPKLPDDTNLDHTV